jgi:hypothetical protein
LKFEPGEIGNSLSPKRAIDGHFAIVGIRPLGDSRYGTLHAGKLPLIRDGARFALRLAGVGLRRLGEGRQVPHPRIGVHKTCPHVFPYVLELM